MKTLICLMVASSAMIQNADAQQEPTTMDSLKRFQWVWEQEVPDPDIIEIYFEFSDSIKYDIEVFNTQYEEWEPSDGVSDVFACRYYLSDSIERTFRESEVGKNRNGRYLIVESVAGTTSVYEIVVLSDRYLGLCLLERDGMRKVTTWKAREKD